MRRFAVRRTQAIPKHARRAGASFAIFGKRLENDGFESALDFGTPLTWRGGFLIEDHAKEFVVVRTIEGNVSHQALVEHDAHTIDVHTTIEVDVAHRLLWRHIVRSAEDRTGDRQLGAGVVGVARDSKVEDFDDIAAASSGDEVDVVGFEIAVNHTVLMRGVEGVEQHGADACDLVLGQSPKSFDSLAQRFAREQLHDEEWNPLFGSIEIEDFDDAFVLNRTRSARFATKALNDLSVIDETLVEHFDRDASSCDDVGSSPHAPHPTLAEKRLDSVLAPKRSTGEVHRGSDQTM